MADDSKQTSALLKRHDQLKRWDESDTNKAADTPRDKPRKVKFQDGCIFLAACSSGDTDEVARLLRRGADINTANVDGLTALHQVDIDVHRYNRLESVYLIGLSRSIKHGLFFSDAALQELSAPR